MRLKPGVSQLEIGSGSIFLLNELRMKIRPYEGRLVFCKNMLPDPIFKIDSLTVGSRVYFILITV